MLIPVTKPDTSPEGDSPSPQPSQNFPKWTWKAQLNEKLAAQIDQDGGEIFGAGLHEAEGEPIDLRAVFREIDRPGRIRGRTSSCNWTRDRLKPEEIEEYNVAMGFVQNDDHDFEGDGDFDENGAS